MNEVNCKLNIVFLFVLKEEEPRVFEMPRSWVSYITISKKGTRTPHELHLMVQCTNILHYPVNSLPFCFQGQVGVFICHSRDNFFRIRSRKLTKHLKNTKHLNAIEHLSVSQIKCLQQFKKIYTYISANIQCQSYINAFSNPNMLPVAVKAPQTAASAYSDLETRWPGRKKVIRYRKAKLEKFAPYLRSDGLLTRLTEYKDLDCEFLREILTF